jgi:hypothetical protein
MLNAPTDRRPTGDFTVNSPLARRIRLALLAFVWLSGAGCRSSAARPEEATAEAIQVLTTDAGDCPPIGAPWPYDTTSAAPPVYVLELINLDRAGQGDPNEYLSFYRTPAILDGWHRRLVAGALTGSPGALVQLWRLDTPYPGAGDASPQLRDFRHYIDFVEHLTDFTRLLLKPMPYFDETLVPTLGNSHPPLLIDHATVKDGAMARFSCLKQTFFKPKVEKQFKWTLLFAGHDLTGPQSAIVNVWALPNYGSLVDAMDAMRQDATYQRELAPCITEEHQNLYRLANTNN